MPSIISPSKRNFKASQSTPRFDARAHEMSPEPARKKIFTGESREPLHERIQRMRGGRAAVPAPPRPGTPRTSSSSAPRTPPNLPPRHECPGAPRKGKVYGLRRLSQYSAAAAADDDDDVLLDRKANERPAGAFLAAPLRSGAGTPGRRSPLRRSWGPDQLADIDAKLHELIHRSAVYGDERGEKPEAPEA